MLDSEFYIYGILVAVFGVVFYFIIMDVTAWKRAPAFEARATLISQNYVGSTHETHSVPTTTINSDGNVGIGVGIVSTGEDERYVTVWQVEGIGKLISDDEGIFRKSKEKAILLIKQKGKEYRIVGVK